MSFIWKPVPDNPWKGGPVFLAPDSTDRNSPPIIRDSSGKEWTGRYVNTNEERHQWVFPSELVGMNDLTVSFAGSTGSIASGGQSYEGGGLGNWQARDKGSVGFGGGGGGAGYNGMFPATPYGQYGMVPMYLGQQFPSPVTTNYKNIKPAPYNFVDPIDFAKEFGDFNRGEIYKNFDASRDIALKELDTELAGLRAFVPAASALKRSEIALDNVFNQQQRTQQIDQTLPGVRDQLNRQGTRAETYAEGRVPDSIQDRALELNIRSRAADFATAGGFGAGSQVSRKVSDLMSAEERIKLSQYGDSLLTQNVGTRANLFLAPTSYSDAGAQVRVMPEVGAGRLTAQNLSEMNQYTTIRPEVGLQSAVQQGQFKSNLIQQTRVFNAGNTLQNDQFNAGIKNQFAMDKFQYDVGFAGLVAGAGQMNINTGIAVDQQKRYEDIFKDALEEAQKQGTISDIGSGLISILGALLGVNNLISGNKKDKGSGGSSSSGSSAGSGSSSGGNSSGGGDNTSIDTPDSGIDTDPTIPSEPISEPEGTDPSTIAPDAEAPPPPDTFNDEPIDEGDSFSADSPSEARVMQFQQDTGVKITNPGNINKSATSVMEATGITSTPTANSVPIGSDRSGNMQHASLPLLQSKDASAGNSLINIFKNTLDPLGVLQAEDSSTLDQIATLSSDAKFISSLNTHVQNNDSKGFINTLLGKMGKPIIKETINGEDNQAGAQAALTAYQLFQNWGTYSPAQKALGVAAAGINGFKFASGNDMWKEMVVPAKDGVPGLNVGQAMNLLSQGYNVYAAVKNWDQLNALQKVAIGTNAASSVVQGAESFGLLGVGADGAAVSVNAAKLAAAGWKPASQYGVGALTGGSSASVPAGFTSVVAKDGSTVIMPAVNTQSAAVQTLGTVAGAASIALGAYQIYQGWGEGGAKGRLNGALGGSAMAAGLYTLLPTQPYLAAAVLATSVLAGSIHTGKSAGQMKRDSMRSLYQKIGISNDKHQVSLADGTLVDIGIDGHGGKHSVTNRDLLVGDHKKLKDLNAWDVDYTNDLDYSTSMGGVALSRILAGRKGSSVDQMGSQIGNAALGNIGFNKEFSEENYGKAMQNMRAMYAKSGISSKNDAYQLANQAFAEGRINDTDLVASHQAFNMIFDENSYGTAQRLMSGRHRGAEVVQETGEIPASPRVPKLPESIKLPSNSPKLVYSNPSPSPKSTNTKMKLFSSKDDVKKQNRNRYAGGSAYGVV